MHSGKPISYNHYFFLAPRRRPRPATVRLGPLRVRALVRVRWPRTGRFRRWRKLWLPISIRPLIWCTSREIAFYLVVLHNEIPQQSYFSVR
jgi:hypothetical protein